MMQYESVQSEEMIQNEMPEETQLFSPKQIASFNIGQVIQHKRFNYRGVIVDVDPSFQGSDEWYNENAETAPPKDAPWYHVIVDEEDVVTYVAERNLIADFDDLPVQHPMLEDFFSGFGGDGKYNLKVTLN